MHCYTLLALILATGFASAQEISDQATQRLIPSRDSRQIIIDSVASLQFYVKHGFPSHRAFVIRSSSVAGEIRDVTIASVQGSDFRFEGAFQDVSLHLRDCRSVRIVGLRISNSVDFSPNRNFIDRPDQEPLAEKNIGYGPDYGVVNVVNCQDITFSNLIATNTKRYDRTPQSLRGHSSCALNIGTANGGATDRIVFDVPTLIGYGKSVCCVHGGATNVTLSNGTARGYYFVLNVGGSDVTVNAMELINEGPGDFDAVDSHGPVNVTASYGRSNGGPVARNARVVFNAVEFNMKNGRPIVTGNADAQTSADGRFYVSHVQLNECVFRFKGPPRFGEYGLVGYDDAWFSIDLRRSGGKVVTVGGTMVAIDSMGDSVDALIDFVTTRDTPAYPKHVADGSQPGFAKFVNYRRGDPIAGTSPVQEALDPLPAGRTTRSDGLSAYSVLPNRQRPKFSPGD